MTPSLLRTIVFVIVFTSSCAEYVRKVDQNGDINPMHEGTIEEALKELNRRLLALPEVVGTAQALCDNKPCLKVYVMKKLSELVRKIPKTIDGYPVVVEETGEIRSLPKNRNH